MLAAVALSAWQATTAPSSAALVAAGDEHYRRRADGARGAVALPAESDAAVAAYRAALALADTPEIRARLLKAMFFRGAFCGAGEDERRRLFDDARTVGDSGVTTLERRVPRSGAERAAALRDMPGAIDLYFWTAAAWGEWALTRSRLTAVRAGAASRIRDLGQTVLDLDPTFEQGGGDRVLGRLHDQCPHIPLLTGWISHEQAIVHLRRALALGPQNTVNQFFLAEALLDHAPAARDEARRLLETCANAAPREAFRVEDAWYAELARKRLAGFPH